MKIPFLSKTHRTLEELEAIREKRTKGIHHFMGVSALIFMGLVAFLGSMLILRPMMELQQLRQLKEQTLYELEKARAEEAEAHNRYVWMTTDPEYYEQLARDRADMAKEGESIIRRPTPADIRRQQQEAQKKKKPRKN